MAPIPPSQSASRLQIPPYQNHNGLPRSSKQPTQKHLSCSLGFRSTLGTILCWFLSFVHLQRALRLTLSPTKVQTSSSTQLRKVARVYGQVQICTSLQASRPVMVVVSFGPEALACSPMNMPRHKPRQRSPSTLFRKYPSFICGQVAQLFVAFISYPWNPWFRGFFHHWAENFVSVRPPALKGNATFREKGR